MSAVHEHLPSRAGDMGGGASRDGVAPQDVREGGVDDGSKAARAAASAAAIRNVLEAEGYGVVFRTNGWVECLLSSVEDSFLGMGVDEGEALRDAVRHALPSHLGRRLVERALGEVRRSGTPETEALSLSSSSPTVPAITAAAGGDPIAHAEAPRTETDAGEKTYAASPLPELAQGPLTQEQIRAYIANQQSALVPSRPKHREPIELLRKLLDAAGEPTAMEGDVDVIEELDQLDLLTNPEETKRWELLPTEMQRLWIGYLVARGRVVRDRVESIPTSKARLRSVIRRFPEYAARVRPGHVNGLKVEHVPKAGTWAAEAMALLDELRAIAWPTQEADLGSQPKIPTRSPRTANARREIEVLDWSHRDTVASMHVLMYGGSPREDARTKLERALGIGTLEWPESDRPRRVDALVERISAGSVDVLLIVRTFVQHKDSGRLIAAAQASGTPFGVVDSGHGIAAVREALSEALARMQAA